MNAMLKISVLFLGFQICNSFVFASDFNQAPLTIFTSESPDNQEAHFESDSRSRDGMETSPEICMVLAAGLRDLGRMQQAQEDEYKRKNASLLRVSRAAGTVAGAAGATAAGCVGAGAGLVVAQRLNLPPSLVLAAGAVGAIGGGVLGYDQSKQQGADLVMQVASAGTQVAEQYRELSPDKKAAAAALVFSAVGAAAYLLSSK